MRCTLCDSADLVAIHAARDPRVYHHCRTCDLRFLEPAQRLLPADEHARYDLHQYDAADRGYADFTAPLVARLERAVRPGARGLDFGAGRVPLLAQALAARGFTLDLYDAFYWPDPAPLARTHDFIVSCEVVEHLFDPAREFARLRAALAPGAPLVLMTERWPETGAFHEWYYRRDPTHVSFYSARTFHWIAAHFGFKTVDVCGRVVCLGA